MKQNSNDRSSRQHQHKHRVGARVSNRSNHDLALIPHVPIRFAHHPLIDHRLARVPPPKQQRQNLPSIIIMNDVIPSILSYCDAATLAQAACVCREWNTLCNQDHLWENLCRQTFGVSAQELKPAPDPVKALYILSHKQLRSICSLNHHQQFIRSIPNVIPMSSFSQVM